MKKVMDENPDVKGLKILVVSNMFPNEKHPNYGVFVQNFCKQLQEIGVSYDTSVLTKQDSKIAKVWRYIIFMISTVWKCLAKDYKYIYVHYLSISSIPVLVAAKVKKIHIIANAHGTDIVPGTSRHKMCQVYTRRILKIAEKIVVPSEYFKRYVMKKYGDIVKGREIYTYPSGGIDTKVFYPVEDKAELYKKYQLNPEEIYLGYCGRVSKEKGIGTFLHAAEKVLAVHKNVKFIIAGSGDYEGSMQQQIRELDLEKAVIRFPMMSQNSLQEVYNILELFVFPTEAKESLGLVAIEAMACGTPVLASEYGAPKYYVKEGVNGFKFPMGDSERLAQLMMSFIEKYRHNDSLIEGALKTAASYETGVIKDQLKKILE